MPDEPVKGLILDLDLPPIELHPNGRAHWRVVGTKKKKYRKLAGDEAAVQCREQLGDRPMWQHVLIHTEFVMQKLSDRDNLIAWIKPTIDGLTDARILTDDRDVFYAPPKRTLDDCDRRVFLMITPIEPGVPFSITVES